MSKWDEIKKSFEKLADKTVTKTRELTDTASLKIKIANKEAERDLEYKNLGRLAYAKLRQSEITDNDDLTAKISASMEKLDKIHDELNKLKSEDKARREAREAEKQNRSAEKAKADKKSDDDEALNLSVMEQFNEARVTSDEEYEKAKAAADAAKGE